MSGRAPAASSQRRSSRRRAAPLLSVGISELVKAVTLPAVVLTAVGTTAAGAVLGAALAASAADAGMAITAPAVVAEAVPFVQAGMILLGALPVAHEYAGSQIRTSVVAVPGRALLLAGKLVATLVVTLLTAAVTVAACLAAADAVLAQLDVAAPRSTGGSEVEVTGAAAYLVIVGLLAAGAALLIRHLVPTLVAVLAAVLIVSPLLASQSEHARWLPDRAARQLFDATDTVLSPGTGALVALAWICLVAAAAAVRFARQDA